MKKGEYLEGLEKPADLRKEQTQNARPLGILYDLLGALDPFHFSAS